jgi:hypothetical protein
MASGCARSGGQRPTEHATTEARDELADACIAGGRGLATHQRRATRGVVEHGVRDCVGGLFVLLRAELRQRRAGRTDRIEEVRVGIGLDGRGRELLPEQRVQAVAVLHAGEAGQHHGARLERLGIERLTGRVTVVDTIAAGVARIADGAGTARIVATVAASIVDARITTRDREEPRDHCAPVRTLDCVPHAHRPPRFAMYTVFAGAGQLRAPEVARHCVRAKDGRGRAGVGAHGRKVPRPAESGSARCIPAAAGAKVGVATIGADGR